MYPSTNYVVRNVALVPAVATSYDNNHSNSRQRPSNRGLLHLNAHPLGFGRPAAALIPEAGSVAMLWLAQEDATVIQEIDV
jgi:hypothetical protein